MPTQQKLKTAGAPLPPSGSPIWRDTNAIDLYQNGWLAGAHGEPKTPPTPYREYRDAWEQGYNAGEHVATQPDPLDVRKFGESKARRMAIEARSAASRTRRTGTGYTPSAAPTTRAQVPDYRDSWSAGYDAGRAGQQRLFGSRDKTSAKAWLAGYDAGAQVRRSRGGR